MMLQASLLFLVSILDSFTLHTVSYSKPLLLSELSFVKQTEAGPTPSALPVKKVLNNDYHIFQSYNNCGPASLSMMLSYFGINKSQEALGQELRPYQIPGGDNDDKSVTLEEMAGKAREYNLLTYHRPNGSITMLREFIAAGIPVTTRTWLNGDEDIGHYRVIKGFDQDARTILQDDSFQNKALAYSYDDFNAIWEKFNYEYLVIVPQEKKVMAEHILGKNLNEKYAWEQARDNSLNKLENAPDDVYSRFNLSVAYYQLGDYKKAAAEYEKAEPQLPSRMLWYQMEPIDAYFKLGNYDKVFALTDSVLNNQNRAYSELYLLRGQIYEKQGNKDAARAEYENAVFYNTSLKSANEALYTL